MFKSTFDVGDATIRTIAQQLSNGMPTDDGRLTNKSNKIVDPKHVEFIRTHIQSFPASESHYNVAKSEKMYYNSDLNLSIMYRLYKTECEGKYEPVCYDTYRLIFKPMKISFRKPRVDTCGECDKLFLQAKLSEGEQKEQILAQHAEHRKKGDLIYQEKSKDMQLAKSAVDICCAAFDLEKQLPTPSLTCGKAFYARQLYTYNLTVYQTLEGNNSSDCYLWNETQAKRGSQEIGSCVLQHLESLPATVQKVIYYSDRSGGQNRNKNIVFMFMLFIERCKAMNRNLVIEHKFMQTGHSHMECDAIHGAIERAKKRNSTNIETPHDWATFISAIYRTTPIRVHELDQCEILALKSLKQRYKIPKKNMLGDPLKFGDIMVLRYNTNCPGLVNYKYHVSDEFYRCFKLLPTEEVMRGINHIVLSPAFFEPVPIPDVKLKDLQKLMPFIKQKDFYTSFLKKLVPGKRGRRAACNIRDDFDADLSESEEEEEEDGT
ncbi:conserved hypothetical protein [Culex quinquefasciatus]|uniref:Uncharacterized protein n=1 Tax=Culex quinquefasciatus TaxID=7176 RepID=B0W7H4_CULQU|nr:conserved hypothetical protein [Culex quinquefasciatus]|eukprot:XP_001844658.1 conserved hypothetical protein [Culex quinquefasciatus]